MRKSGKFISGMASAALLAALSMAAVSAWGMPFFFSTGDPDGKMATGSRPGTGGNIEIESADDFVLTGSLTTLTNATFVGLLTGGATTADIGEVRVEIYRVFPNDSNNPPSGKVPSRANSPSDVELVDRDTAAGNLSFVTTDLGGFTANNSVLNGIFPKPNQTTQGEGPVTGEEIAFSVTFTTPIDLPPDHYFFIPQVEVTDPAGNFFWLSAPRPIVPPGTSFPAGFTDLQSWIRNENLAPDWLRIGTDIVGPPVTGGAAPTFNAVFSLTGRVPEPGTLALLGAGCAALWWRRRRQD